jgi:hypothetical protein
VDALRSPAPRPPARPANPPGSRTRDRSALSDGRELVGKIFQLPGTFAIYRRSASESAERSTTGESHAFSIAKLSAPLSPRTRQVGSTADLPQRSGATERLDLLNFGTVRLIQALLSADRKPSGSSNILRAASASSASTCRRRGRSHRYEPRTKPPTHLPSILCASADVVCTLGWTQPSRDGRARARALQAPFSSSSLYSSL